MGPKQFSSLSKKYFGEILEPLGFETYELVNPLYHRTNDNKISQVIIPQLGSRGVWFDILIFVASPEIHQDFFKEFPNYVHDTSGGNCYLHPDTGVGFDQMMYRCRTKEGFIRNFLNQAKPALEQHALPYFDRIKSLNELVGISSIV